MYLIQGIILLLLSISRVQSHSIKALPNETSEKTDNNIDQDYFSVSAIIERANKNAGKSKGEFTIIHGDIAVYTGLQNADPCTSRGCKWRRGSDGKVKVPFTISRQYCEYHFLPGFKVRCVRAPLDIINKLLSF
ncbi:hypothetical protein AMELA_G00014790 [Ameiurus melas]|uniref:Secreted protein n=1 Tax=Ameiurus melas TaxID=219545 RepID=A0A7J6BHQ7_AMEME|nr:hypothetical protein AMELA_G00014790 [Ameiurus melas]